MNIFKKDGTLKKRVTKMASNLEMEIQLCDMVEAPTPQQVWIWDNREDMEPLVIYGVTEATGLLYFVGAPYLPPGVKEELPATIADLHKLEELLEFLYSENCGDW